MNSQTRRLLKLNLPCEGTTDNLCYPAQISQPAKNLRRVRSHLQHCVLITAAIFDYDRVLFSHLLPSVSSLGNLAKSFREQPRNVDSKPLDALRENPEPSA